MNYKYALGLFSFLANNGPLTSQNFTFLLLQEKYENIIDVSQFGRLSAKRQSGDLDRLFRMGFLSRKRVKREIMTKRQLKVHRGFEYEYKISTQGRQYLAYINRPKETKKKPLRESVHDLIQESLIDDLYNRIPENIADEYRKLFKYKKFEDKGRHKRFPVASKRELLYSLEECRDKLDRMKRGVIARQIEISPFYTQTSNRFFLNLLTIF